MATDHIFTAAHVKARHPFGPLGLSVLTLGVYWFYWHYTINREMRDLGEDVNPGTSLLAVTLGLLALVPPIVSVYRTAERVARLQQRAQTPTAINPAIAAAMLVVPMVNVLQTFYVQSNVNSAYEAMDRDLEARVQDLMDSIPVAPPADTHPPAEPA